jgi:uncharacterized membrane protein YphA (DoxX/SURF4 family)
MRFLGRQGERMKPLFKWLFACILSFVVGAGLIVATAMLHWPWGVYIPAGIILEIGLVCLWVVGAAKGGM